MPKYWVQEYVVQNINDDEPPPVLDSGHINELRMLGLYWMVEELVCILNLLGLKNFFLGLHSRLYDSSIGNSYRMCKKRLWAKAKVGMVLVQNISYKSSCMYYLTYYLFSVNEAVPRLGIEHGMTLYPKLYSLKEGWLDGSCFFCFTGSWEVVTLFQ